jgi:hypothetical protein
MSRPEFVRVKALEAFLAGCLRKQDLRFATVRDSRAPHHVTVSSLATSVTPPTACIQGGIDLIRDEQGWRVLSNVRVPSGGQLRHLQSSSHGANSAGLFSMRVRRWANARINCLQALPGGVRAGHCRSQRGCAHSGVYNSVRTHPPPCAPHGCRTGRRW